MGDNTPAILGNQIPVSYFPGDNLLEISVNITASKAAKRVSSMILSYCSKLDIELAILIQGQDESELPEQILGAFRVLHADLCSLRSLDEDSPAKKESEDESESQRPDFLPKE